MTLTYSARSNGRLLWFSAPSNLNGKFVDNGTKVSELREIVNNATELASNKYLTKFTLLERA